MSMYTFAINFISEKKFHFLLEEDKVSTVPSYLWTLGPFTPAAGQPGGGGGTPPRRACVSVRPGTEQFLKLWTVCKQHLPKKALEDTKEPWRECRGWPPFSSWSCSNASHHSTQRYDLEGRWESHLWLPRAEVLPALPRAGDQPQPSTHRTGSHPKGSGKQADPQAFYCGHNISDFNLETHF